MKIQDSGMPDKTMWEEFFSPAQILETLRSGLLTIVMNAEYVRTLSFGAENHLSKRAIV